MRWLTRLVRTLFNRNDDGTGDELRQHIDLETQDLIAHGVAPDEARRQALLALGGVDRFREEAHDTRGLRWLTHARRDVGYAFRSFQRSPGFTAIVVLTLALGVGANAAVFQIVDAVMLRTLPVEDPQALADIRITDRAGARGGFPTWRVAMTWPIWDEVQRHGDPFAGMFAWATESHSLAMGGDVRWANVLRMSSNGFDVLGVRPLMGRTFTPAGDRTDCGGTGVVISERFWEREYGRAPDVLARTLTLSSQPFPIVGVMPASFTGLAVGESFDVVVPLCAESYLKPGNMIGWSGTYWWLSFAGRLKPDWSRERASAYLAAVSPAIFKASLPTGYPAASVDRYLTFTLAAEPLEHGVSNLRNTYTTPLMLLFGIAGVVLLATCGNIANLLLARASTREREIGLRLALGATRGHLLVQSLIYSLVLAASGAVLGLVVANGLSHILLTLLATSGNSVALDLRMDWRLFGFVGALALLTCVVFGTVPALRSTDAPPTLAGGGRGHSASRRHIRVRRGLVVVQVALSLVLVVTAVLFAGTLRNLMNEEIGFDSEHLLVANLGFGGMRVPTERVTALRTEVLQRLRAAPGVDHVSDGIYIPLMGGYRGNRAWADGHEDAGVPVSMGWIGGDYFETLDVPLLAGREFEAREQPNSTPTAIVNETLARRLFDGTNPIGRIVRIEATPTMPEMAYHIVGLVKDMKYRALRESPPPVVFTSLLEAPANGSDGRILVRSALPTADLQAIVRTAVADVSPEISVSLYRHADFVNDLLVRERLMATLSVFFGGLAAVLAMMGVYGVMSYTVASREREIAVRLALGADRRGVLLLILGQAAMLLVGGLMVGMVVAAFAARAATTLLFGLTPSDPLAYALAAGLLAVVMFIATSLPAVRAMRVDPAQALRGE